MIYLFQKQVRPAPLPHLYLSLTGSASGPVSTGQGFHKQKKTVPTDFPYRDRDILQFLALTGI